MTLQILIVFLSDHPGIKAAKIKVQEKYFLTFPFKQLCPKKGSFNIAYFSPMRSVFVSTQDIGLETGKGHDFAPCESKKVLDGFLAITSSIKIVSGRIITYDIR